METTLPFKPFTRERPEFVDKDWRDIRLTRIECGVAVVFGILFVLAACA